MLFPKFSRIHSFPFWFIFLCLKLTVNLLHPGVSSLIDVLYMHLFWAVQSVQFAVSTFCLVFGQKHREMETARASRARRDSVRLLSLQGWGKKKKMLLIWEICWKLLIRTLIPPSWKIKAYLSDAVLILKRTILKVCYYFCIPSLIRVSQLLVWMKIRSTVLINDRLVLWSPS